MDPSGIMTDAIANLTSTFGTIAPAAIGVAVAVFALQFGWRLVRKFVK